jgi:hypothetical protein
MSPRVLGYPQYSFDALRTAIFAMYAPEDAKGAYMPNNGT